MSIEERQKLEAVLTAYLFAVEEVGQLRDRDDISMFLRHNRMHHGLCHFIDTLIWYEDQDIPYEWIDDHLPVGSDYLAPIPCDVDYSKEETLQALHVRIITLRKELNLN